MNKYFLLFVIFCIGLLSSCGSDNNDDEPIVSETYSASFDDFIDGDVRQVIMETTSAKELAEILPCEISVYTNDIDFCLGGKVTTTYTLDIQKWQSASLSILSKKNIEYAVYSVTYTSYQFTPGEYAIELNGYERLFLVTETYIALLNANHEEINQIIELTDCKRIYDEVPETPTRKYNKEETETYSEPFSLNKLADDHFYIENSDYTFECFLTAKGLKLNEVSPDEKEIGILSKK